MKNGSLFLIFLGLIIQIVLLFSIFDIYFTSTVVQGVEPVNNTIGALCKRVVVISVDGLRLDALWESAPYSDLPAAPYIRWSMDNEGSWGVCHCHLPTESRPGHVAMLAGFYEDPAAVMKGWKENPVDFDSSFNQAECSFAWGSPDIVNIFFKGLNHNCSYKFMYDQNQNFAGNTMELDNWVHNNVRLFFNNSDNIINYSKEKSLFFLHLLGQDTSGHTHKPHTFNYIDNLRNVDRIVKDVNSLFNTIFKDNETAFILTADHGMTDWGSHGAGDSSETEVPIVAWGSGIRKHEESELQINQSDVTPLIAILLGTSIPVNSIGVLPSIFLNVTTDFEAHAIFFNARQILAQFLAKKTEVETKSPWLMYKSFDTSTINNLIDKISVALSSGYFIEAKDLSLELVNLALVGIQFYQNFFQNILFFLTTLSYVLWIAILIATLNAVDVTPKFNYKSCFFLLPVSTLSSFLVFKQNLPISYHAYVLLPIIQLWLLSKFAGTFIIIAKKLGNVRHWLIIILFICGIELLVLVFFQRWVLSICIFAITIIRVKYRNLTTKKDFTLYVVWVLSGVALGIFCNLSVVGKDAFPFLILETSIIICVVNLWRVPRFFIISMYQNFLFLVSGINSFLVQSSFIGSNEINFYHQYLSWALLGHLPFFLFIPVSNAFDKLNSIFISLSIPFILLTISHEGLFLLTLFINLTCWVYVEKKNLDSFRNFNIESLRADSHKSVTISDFCLAYSLLTYVFVAFFGTGNLATLSSFDPAWVRCFLTNFSPFTMTALILFKVITPIFAAMAAFRVLTKVVNVNAHKVFLCLLIYCNVMGMNFLFLVRNEGSWLDIGTSLSHYVIQQVSIVFLLILYAISLFIIS